MTGNYTVFYAFAPTGYGGVETNGGGRGDRQILTNYWKDWSFCLKELVCEIRLLVWEASHQFIITKSGEMGLCPYKNLAHRAHPNVRK